MIFILYNERKWESMSDTCKTTAVWCKCIIMYVVVTYSVTYVTASWISCAQLQGRDVKTRSLCRRLGATTGPLSWSKHFLLSWIIRHEELDVFRSNTATKSGFHTGYLSIRRINTNRSDRTVEDILESELLKLVTFSWVNRCHHVYAIVECQA